MSDLQLPGFLANATTTDDTKSKKQKAVVYGSGGSGKTLFAGSWPKPLMMDLDEGSKTLRKQGIIIPKLTFDYLDVKQGKSRPYQEIMMTLDMWDSKEGPFSKAGPYADRETLILDGITNLADLILAEVMYEQGKNQANSKPGYDEYAMLKNRAETILKFIRSMNIFVVATAQMAWKETDSGEMRPMPNAVGSVREMIPYVFNELYYMHVEELGGNHTYRMYTKEWRKHDAKSREDLPAVVTWEKTETNPKGFPKYDLLYGDWKQYV